MDKWKVQNSSLYAQSTAQNGFSASSNPKASATVAPYHRRAKTNGGSATIEKTKLNADLSSSINSKGNQAKQNQGYIDLQAQL